MPGVPGVPAEAPGAGPSRPLAADFDPMRLAKAVEVVVKPVRTGPKPFVSLILSCLLATVPWAVVGLIYSAVTSGIGTELVAILLWGGVAVAVGASTATSLDESFSRPATRMGIAVGMIASLIWGLIFYLGEETLARQGLGAQPGWFSAPLVKVMVLRIGNLTPAASGILGLVKGAIVGASGAVIYDRFFAAKEEAKRQALAAKAPPPPPPAPTPPA